MGGISTNGVEGFWSLLKPGMKGKFYHISLRSLQTYIDEFVWKYNNRQGSQSDEFELVID